MKAFQQKNLVRLLLPLGFASLVLVILLSGLAQEAEAEPKVLSATKSQEQNHHRSPDYQTGVSVCEQTPNLVLNLNPGFEQGGGDPWVPYHWYKCGACHVSYDDPGPDSSVSAKMVSDSPKSADCRLVTTPIRETPVDEGRFCDYYGWVNADLTQGDAYLRVVFWSCPDVLSGCTVGEGHTTPVTDTQGKWVRVTGSAQAPLGAKYARVEVVLPASSVGTVHFDDVYLGLATCLDISKYDDPDPVARGQMLTYTIIYSNTGREKATGVQVIEDYDDDDDRYVHFEWAQPPPLTHTTTHWNVPDMLAGTSGAITVMVRVADDTGERASLVNGVQIYSRETVKPVYTVISTTITPPPDGCDLNLYLPNVAQSGTPGQRTDYDVTLTNAGACDGRLHLMAISSQGWEVITPSLPYTLTSGHSERVAVGIVVPPDVLRSTIVVTDVTLITATLDCGLSCSRTATAVVAVTSTVTAITPTDVVIDGPATGETRLPYAFTAGISPITATPPITYHWQATEQKDIVTNTNGLNHTVLFTWSTTGTKTITVTAANARWSVSDAHSISIEWRKIYLPLILRRWPPIPDTPVMDAISNSDIDGNYTVSWNATHLADTYTLQEDDNPSFSSPIIRYTGPMTSWNANGQAAGVYYYQVKANNGQWSSDWSNVKSVSAWWELEPNNSRSLANGPLVSGRSYYGYPNDKWDCFKMDIHSKGKILASLTNHTGKEVRLLIADPDGNVVARDSTPPYYTEYTAPSRGLYYICIDTDSGYNTKTPYTLEATFP